MKPDKHKKEKNAQYKKKHGIPDTSRQDKKPDQDRRGTTVAAAASTVHCRPTQNNRSEFNERDGKSAEQKAIDVQESSEISETESFRRRKIVSNWERYEVEDDDGKEQTLRGSDFATLLKFSANVQSHFQYQVDDGLAVGEEQLNTEARFLNLDCDDLAMSLMCIPLHERLAVETSLFEPSQVQRCVEISKENLSRYSDVKDRVSTEAMEILPSCSAKLHKEPSFQVQNEMKAIIEAEIEESLEENSQDLVKNLRQADLKTPQISVTGSVPKKQDASSLLETKLPNTLPKDPTASEQSQNVSNGEDDKTPRKQHLMETLDAVESTGFSKDALETKAEAGNTKNKQTLKELENELDLLLAL